MKRRVFVGAGVIGILLAATVTAGGRVPTTYNQRYQALFAEQEMFRKRPELLSCVLAARDYVQTDSASVFNKLRFTPKSLQTAYVDEGSINGKNFCMVRMHGEGRIRAYSFLENWEGADISCYFVSSEDPVVHLGVRE